MVVYPPEGGDSRFSRLPAGRGPGKILMFTIYILKSNKTNDWSYVGVTKNLTRRWHEHQLGKVCSTKAHRPLLLIHTELIKNQELALKREKFLKSGCGREEKNNIINIYSGVV